MPLIFTALGEMALSKAKGPSSRAPVICLRSAILHKAAASMVDCISGDTVSTAAKIATLGSATPRICATSMAFWVMSALSCSEGRMLSAASVIRIGLS